MPAGEAGVAGTSASWGCATVLSDGAGGKSVSVWCRRRLLRGIAHSPVEVTRAAAEHGNGSDGAVRVDACEVEPGLEEALAPDVGDQVDGIVLRRVVHHRQDAHD